MIYLSHRIDFDMDYNGGLDGASCAPCGWFTERTGAEILSAEILAHAEETVPLWSFSPVLWNKNTGRMERYEKTNIIVCNVCWFSSGNTGLDMTLEEVMIKHFADRHPEIAHPALPHNTGV